MIAANAEGQQSLSHLLKGVFAYAYSGYHAELPSVALLRNAPRIGSYLERTRPVTGPTPLRGWEFYDEIDGYVLVDYVGWIDFHGDGMLSGGGTTQRAGSRAVPFTHAGTYIVESAQPQLLSGDPSPAVILTHIVANRDSTRRLKFTVLDGEKGRLVAAGTMVQR
jgi:hypothetical protein